MDLAEMRDRIREVVARDDVRRVVGYEKATFGFGVRPAFFTAPDDVERFVYSPACVNDLAVYVKLEERPPLPRGATPDTRKVGIVAKGCDTRAILQLCQENIVKRDGVVIIGVPCRGIVDLSKLGAAARGDVRDAGDSFVVTADGVAKEFARDDLLAERCKVCRHPMPVQYDVLLGEPAEARLPAAGFADIAPLEQRSAAERWRYWEQQFARCTRCYACRNVCPMCYCKRCIMESLAPQWVFRSNNVSENLLFHVIRAYHLAGRCIECDECSRVCPVDIPLRQLNRRFVRDVLEFFGHEAGMSSEGQNVLTTFDPNDPGAFIL